jgi:ABC-type glycerol-3-phosphate transport system permease component
MKESHKKGLWKAIVSVVLVFIMVIVLFPVFITISVSFKPPPEVLKYPPTFLPIRPTLQNYTNLLIGRNFFGYIVNTIYIAAVTILFSLGIGTLAAYALSRHEFRGRKLLSNSVLLAYMFPQVLLVIPLYMNMNSWGLVDTRTSLIIAYITFSLPLCIWLLKGYFDGLPPDIENSARIDGCSEMGILVRIVLPLSAPGVMSAGAFSFMLVWLEYLFAMTFVTTGAKLTITAGIASVVGQYWAGYGMLMAASVIATVPAIFFFAVAQRFVIGGLLAGAVKG